MKFPTGAQLENTDVLVMFAAEAGSIAGADRDNLEKFLKRGGGIVCIHDAVCGTNAPWFKTIIGGAWEHGKSKWFEGDVSFYYVNNEHPITEGCSNYDIDDEVYWDLHMMPDAKILGASWQPDQRNTRNGKQYPHVYNVIPQMWVYENALDGGQPYRAFVSIPGHKYSSFEAPHYRAVLLRGIAWAAKRDVNSLCAKDELATLRYPEGGPTAPEKEASKLELHPDFKISLVAAEPLITKPIAIDWDPAGRLWVAETPEYPNGRRGIRAEEGDNAWKDHGGLVAQAGAQDRPARDRISILIDENKDGRADRKQVFYEGLELVTSFVFHRDGVIVAQAPDILWLRDVNGDGTAEKVEKLYTGLGISDRHATINNLRWGFDGWIYATHGYSAGTVTSPDGSKNFGRINSGVVRFKPDGSAFEQFSSKGGNTWGLDIAWDNEVFFTQPTSGDLLNHVVLPEYVLARGKTGNTASFHPIIRGRRSNPLIKYENLAYVQIDVVGGFTASAGCAIYDGGAWPSDYQYSYFTTEPTINLIHHEAVTHDAVTYAANKLRDPEFIGGRDKWFRPIETRIGPDGALYILDFYNQAVIHNDTRGPKHNAVNAAVRPDRDHYFGRIWRVEHKQAKKLDLPNLAKASSNKLMEALEHPNRVVRMTAHRLLSEMDPPPRRALAKLAWDQKKPPYARIHATWLSETVSPALMADNNPAVAKNALRVAAHRMVVDDDLIQALLRKDPQVRLAALLAAANSTAPRVIQAAVDTFPELTDGWSQSALIAAADVRPQDFIEAVFKSSRSDELAPLLGNLVRLAAGIPDAEEIAARLVERAASASDALKLAALENLATYLKADVPWSPSLESGFNKLLISENLDVTAASLPLLARWKQGGSASAKPLVTKLLAQLQKADGSVVQGERIVTSLVRARALDPDILPQTANLLGSRTSETIQKRLILALGETSDSAVGPILATALGKLQGELRDAAFAQLIKRADWANALVDELKKGTLTLAALGPGNVFRLRTHSDKSVAENAAAVIDQLRGPEVKEKEAVIAKLEPTVAKPGSAERGKQVFTQNCGVCHKVNDDGRDVGPDLTGMGVHGVHELLTHILDPNRFVEENYVATSIETKDDQVLDGIVVRENRSAVVLRNNVGETEVKTSDIKSRRSTGRSLMPEGFEALGEDPLRDLLTFLGAGDNRFKIIDLKPAFTASSAHGLFNSRDSLNEGLRFRKFGLIKAGDVPFEVVNPARTTSGNNLIVLKGGQNYAKTHPQKVEITGIGLKASKLHFLGGVGGWAYPYTRQENMPVAKVTLHFDGGDTEEIVLKNGVEIADYNGGYDVPGSTRVPELIANGQVRSFSKVLHHGSAIQKITIESMDNAVAPVFIAITAETGKQTEQQADASGKGGGNGGAVTSGMRVLIVGGGSSHDFNRWFNQADSATLATKAKVQYTEDISSVLPALKTADVLYLSNNKPMDDPDLRKAIFAHADAGKGLLLVHPALWYNWKDWPEYNRVFIGGGSKSHDKYGEFEVTVKESGHPIMQGVPATFKITDELYHHEKDPQGSPIEVLATGTSPVTGKTFPVAWITQHPKARIVCLTLGHDGKAHEHPAYKTILQNSIAWVARQ
ncbi:MAG TPA: PVC-type heme-binding CxxCH protein [Verrucomicrobiae bacterium]|nr:PVC-type heme-binding CxxCH protein [Verrucomicrobiae bacterium]